MNQGEPTSPVFVTAQAIVFVTAQAIVKSSCMSLPAWEQQGHDQANEAAKDEIIIAQEPEAVPALEEEMAGAVTAVTPCDKVYKVEIDTSEQEKWGKSR